VRVKPQDSRTRRRSLSRNCVSYVIFRLRPCAKGEGCFSSVYKTLHTFNFFSFRKLHSETVFSICQLLQWECPLTTHMSYRRSRAPRRAIGCHVRCRTLSRDSPPSRYPAPISDHATVIRIHRLRIMIPHRLPSFRMRRSYGPGLIFTINPLPTDGAGNFSLGF